MELRKDSTDLVKTKYVNDSKITDHYALIPTGQGFENYDKLPDLQKNVYRLIVKRFLAIFYPPAEYNKVSVTIEVENGQNKEEFSCSGKVCLNQGYLEVLKGKSTESTQNVDKSQENFEDEIDSLTILAELKKGKEVDVINYETKEAQTNPPTRYNSGSMILAMENAGKLIEDEELREQIKGAGIGTSATRDGIITKLEKNKYISLNKKTQIVTPTFLGEIIYDIVYYSINGLLRADLTASWEKGLEGVAEGQISRQEYTDKMTTFVTRYTNLVKQIQNQNGITGVFDRTKIFYTKSGSPKRDTKAETKTGENSDPQ